jgi:8-hydroxy-5-deazaflavin:NADPH oxidoreductase
MISRKHLPSTRRILLMLAGVIATGVVAAVPLTALAQAKPRIGFIGAGREGGALATLFTQAGYKVKLSARDLGKVKELAAQLGPNASAGTPAEAIAWANVVVISVPYAALPQLGRDYGSQLKGKVVIETSNPSVQRDGDMAKDAVEKGSGVMDAVYLSGAKVVRAFNAINYKMLLAGAHRPGELVGVAMAADDPRALAIVKKIVTNLGFEPVVVGGLDTSKRFDPGTPIFPKAMPASELRAALGVK